MKVCVVSVVVATTMMVSSLLLATAVVEAVAAVDDGVGRHKRSEPEGAQWSQWFNSDRPTDGEGDFETTDSIQTNQKICPGALQVVQAECRVSGTNDSFDSTTTAFVDDHLLQACSSHGLICLNAQQASGLCADYEVRFLCRDLNSDRGGGGSIFPNFDFKIYIILALVPLVIVSLRIIWSCCCKQRLKRNRQRRGTLASQRSSLASSGTLSTSSSQASFDSALANPPPSYADLFGNVEEGRVFAISDGGGSCLACGKCLHHAGYALPTGSSESYGYDGGNRGVGSLSGPSEGYGYNGRRVSSVLGPSGSQAVTVEGGRVGVSSTGDAAGIEDEVFTRPDSSNTTSTDSTTTSQQQQQQQTTPTPTLFHSRMSITSGSSVLGAVGLPVSSLPPAGTPCACACHRKQSGHTNLGFHWEPSEQVNSPTPVVYPGMHKPVFSFSRIGSVSSFTSFTEPPDYEEALEILKKAAPDLVGDDHEDETKVAM